MKGYLVLVIVVVGVVALLISGCAALRFTIGAGPMVEKNYPFTEFNSVEISNNFQYEITQAPVCSVVVSTHQNLVERLDVNQSGNTVEIGFIDGNFTNTDAKVIITAPNLNRLVVTGASGGSIRGFKSESAFDVRVSGASNLDLDMETGLAKVNISGASKVTGTLKAKDTRLNVSGASRCSLAGSAAATEVEVSGASQANLPNFYLQEANVNVSGASRATINTDGTLNLNVTGASRLNYLGSPKLAGVDVSGASTIDNK